MTRNNPNNNGGYGRGGYGRGGYGGRGNGGNSPSMASRGGTVLYDAVFLASNDVMAKQTGRRALILLTDGEDRHSKESLTEAIEAAQRADTVVYAIYYKGEQRFNGFPGGHRGGYPGGGYPGGGYPGGGYPGGGYPGGGYPGGGGRPGSDGTYAQPDGKKILQRICGETGGHMFEVKGKGSVDKIYKEIGDELRAQYRLGFTPSGDAGDPGLSQGSAQPDQPRRQEHGDPDAGGLLHGAGEGSLSGRPMRLAAPAWVLTSCDTGCFVNGGFCLLWSRTLRMITAAMKIRMIVTAESSHNGAKAGLVRFCLLELHNGLDAGAPRRVHTRSVEEDPCLPLRGICVCPMMKLPLLRLSGDPYVLEADPS